MVPYEDLELMTEAAYTDNGERTIETIDLSVWGPDREIALIKGMLEELKTLDEPARRIRSHISSFMGCDSGVPATIDEILNGIGRGKLDEPAFVNGCRYHGFCTTVKSSQPRQIECMLAIYRILNARLSGESRESLLQSYPWADDFIGNVYTWLPQDENETELQKLLVERMLLPFGYLTEASKANPASDDRSIIELVDATMKNCYQDGGRGSQIDAEIEKLAGLPKIGMAYPQDVQRAPISDRTKLDLFTLCCSLAHGLHTLCDCHHSTFRWIENWIYAIGTGKWGIPTRRLGAESERLSHLMFGYLLAFDKWLLGIPQQFLLLYLGHVDLGFDPKNEIVRTYAYLGSDHTPEKEWLVAYFWTNLMYNNGGLLWRNRHEHLTDQAQSVGVLIREWIDRQLPLYT